MITYYRIANKEEIAITDLSFNTVIYNTTFIESDNLKNKYLYFNNVKKRILDYNISTGNLTIDNVFEEIIYPESLMRVFDYEGSVIMDEIIHLTAMNSAIYETLQSMSGLKRTETDKNKIEFATIADNYSLISKNLNRITYLESLLRPVPHNESNEDNLINFKRIDYGYY